MVLRIRKNHIFFPKVWGTNMQIKVNCTRCEGTGKITQHSPGLPPVTIECVICGSLGYSPVDIIGTELEDMIAKIDAIKVVVDQIKIKTKA
jgi:hypothetical protein